MEPVLPRPVDVGNAWGCVADVRPSAAKEISPPGPEPSTALSRGEARELLLLTMESLCVAEDVDRGAVGERGRPADGARGLSSAAGVRTSR